MMIPSKLANSLVNTWYYNTQYKLPCGLEIVGTQKGFTLLCSTHYRTQGFIQDILLVGGGEIGRAKTAALVWGHAPPGILGPLRVIMMPTANDMYDF